MRGPENGPGDGCQWLVERASGNPEPDCYADTITIDPCGAAPAPQDGEPMPFCRHHLEMATMDELEFEHHYDNEMQ